MFFFVLFVNGGRLMGREKLDKTQHLVWSLMISWISANGYDLVKKKWKRWFNGWWKGNFLNIIGIIKMNLLSMEVSWINEEKDMKTVHFIRE